VKRILVDTNVILDVLLDRQPHAAASSLVWRYVETGAIEGRIAAHSVTTLHYLVQKARGAAAAKRTVAILLSVFGVAAVDISVLSDALSVGLHDFEDAVTAAAAAADRCDWIVSRDLRGFRNTAVPCITPEALGPLLDTE